MLQNRVNESIAADVEDSNRKERKAKQDIELARKVQQNQLRLAQAAV